MLIRHLRNTFFFFTLMFAAHYSHNKLNSPGGSKALLASHLHNENSIRLKVIDSATVFLRSRERRCCVADLWAEAAPDSSVFRGLLISAEGKADTIVPQIFILPDAMKGKDGSMSQFKQLLRSKRISRKPLVFKKNPDGIQILDVYDTKEEATVAAKEYKELEKERRMQKLALSSQPEAPVTSEVNKSAPKLPSKDAVEAARKAERMAALEAMAKAAQKREEERLRKEKLEAKKREEELAKQKALAAEEIARRKQEAARLAAEALKKYQASEFEAAEKLFEQSTQLDPENSTYYFQYGVTLFRINKLDDAMIKFNLANTSGTEEIEKQYFMGLTHYKLNEWDQAATRFDSVKNTNVKPLSPSAAFYKGMILYNKEEWKLAQPEFEYVLDNSADPKLDAKAEEYIDKIIRQLQFQKLQEKPHTLALTGGAMYDSNVLLSADNTDSGSATDKASARSVASVDYTWRAIYKRTYDLSLNANIFYIYSINEAVKEADPLLYTFMVPYSYKTTIGNKSYIFKVSPGYESLALDTIQTQNSIVLDISNTLVMDANWISTYDLEVRQDDNVLDTSTGDDDADATKIEFETTQTYFLDNKKTKAVIGTLGFTSNAAVGENLAYTRSDLGELYDACCRYRSHNGLRTSMYQSTYENDRKDTNMALDISLSKPF
ncbi:MAG: hypothetical protein R2827_15510 [Bdellovibrionales bacterium]